MSLSYSAPIKIGEQLDQDPPIAVGQVQIELHHTTQAISILALVL